MSKIPDSKMQAWLKATSSEGKGQAVLKRVQLAGEFCERTCRLSETETLNSLSGIDFSSQVLVVRLPKKAYVQYRSRHPNKWFTDTGLTPDQVGIVKGERQRELFFPAGVVFALKCRAKSIRDNWTPGRIFDKSELLNALLGVPTRGGGTQYLVHDRFQMERLQ